MISILAAWVYILALCSLYGWLLLAGIRHFTLAKSENVPLVLVPLLGLITISMITICLSFFGGIGFAANGIIVGFALLLGWVKREPLIVEVRRSCEKAMPRHYLSILLLAILAAVLAFKSSVGRNLLHFDTGYYHAQSIEWIVQYGIAPGLGNLHTPLAYDSLWFQPCALFSFTFLLHQPLHALLGLMIFIAFCFAFAGLLDVLSPLIEIQLSSVVQALLLVPLLELASNLSSPSTDEPTSIFIFLLFALFCRYKEQEAIGYSTDILQWSIVLLAIFATLLKLSALPVLLFIPFVAYREFQRGHTWTATTYILLVPLLWLPKLIRTVILSGYLIYPYPNIDLFPVDWKMPIAVVQDQKRFIESWGRSPFSDPKEVLSQGFGGWFPNWFANFIKGYAAVGLLFALLSILIFLALQLSFRRGSRSVLKQTFERYSVVYAVSFIGVAYWFSISPMLRYGFGFFWTFVVMLSAPLLFQIGKYGPKVFRGDTGEKVLVAVASLLIWLVLRSESPQRALGSGIVFSRFYTTDIRSLLWQEKYPFVETLSAPMNNVVIYRPLQGEQCWDHPLPCTPYLYTPIEGRGTSLKDGFRALSGDLGIFDAKRILVERGKR
ncbi:MAG: hypothetical protein H7Y37_07985 [Anaerolineae bacterium]|nr:hypothetical protein [Gloeobacterales cyanobacterium ES-bin-313]